MVHRVVRHVVPTVWSARDVGDAGKEAGAGGEGGSLVKDGANIVAHLLVGEAEVIFVEGESRVRGDTWGRDVGDGGGEA